VTIDLALAWALEPEVAPGSVVPSVRLLVARGFARYMAGIDPRTEIPPAGLVAFRRRRRAPFIYSDADIAALMEQARRSIREPLRAATYQTLIGLLAASGCGSARRSSSTAAISTGRTACCSYASRSGAYVDFDIC
jgi:integrase/recombinase XerD